MECFDAGRVHVYRRCGCVIIKKIVCGEKMNFNRVVSISFSIRISLSLGNRSVCLALDFNSIYNFYYLM